MANLKCSLRSYFKMPFVTVFSSLKWISSTFWWNRDRNAVLCLCLTFRAVTVFLTLPFWKGKVRKVVTVFLTLPFWKGRVRKVGKPRKEKLNKDTKSNSFSFIISHVLNRLLVVLRCLKWFYNRWNSKWFYGKMCEKDFTGKKGAWINKSVKILVRTKLRHLSVSVNFLRISDDIFRLVWLLLRYIHFGFVFDIFIRFLSIFDKFKISKTF